MSDFMFTSIRELLDSWIARLKEWKAKEKEFLDSGHPNESCIFFGHVVEISNCIQDLIDLIGHIYVETQEVRIGLESTYLKYDPNTMTHMGKKVNG